MSLNGDMLTVQDVIDQGMTSPTIRRVIYGRQYPSMSGRCQGKWSCRQDPQGFRLPQYLSGLDYSLRLRIAAWI